MNPTEFRLTLAVLCLTELLFGIAYNWLIANSDRFPFTHALTAISVVVGNTVTLALVGFFFRDLPVTMWQAVQIIFVAFVCSGLPMIVGYRARYMRALRAEDEEREARSRHQRLKWPHSMKKARDEAAETAMAALRALNSLPESLRTDEQVKIGRAREYLTRVIGLLVEAGAQVSLSDI